MVPIDGGKKLVTLVDTPGFNDSSRNDATILTAIADELRRTYVERRKFSGIIYFHRISDPRMEGSTIKQLQLFRELCGDDSGMLKNVILATNRWDRLENEDLGVRRQKELEGNPRFWKPMCLKGSQVRRFDGTSESALELIRHVMRNTPQALKIQQEMVDDCKPLSETGAGRFVEAEIAKMRKQYEQNLTTIKEEMTRALLKKDQQMHQLLKEESERSRKEIDELRKQHEMLRVENEEAMKGERKLRMEAEDEMVRWKAETAKRMNNEIAQLKVEAAEKLTQAIEKSRVETEEKLRKEVNEESRQRIKQSREETENRLRAEAETRMKHESELLEKRMEKQLKERIEESRKELEQRLSDEQDLKDAGYVPCDDRNSATKVLFAAVQKRLELRIIRLLLEKGGDPASCIYVLTREDGEEDELSFYPKRRKTMDLYMKEREKENPMPTAKAGAQCRVPVPSRPPRHGGRRGRQGQVRPTGASEADGGKRGWWGQARPMGAVSRRAKSLVNTPPLAQGFPDK